MVWLPEPVPAGVLRGRDGGGPLYDGCRSIMGSRSFSFIGRRDCELRCLARSCSDNFRL